MPSPASSAAAATEATAPTAKASAASANTTSARPPHASANVIACKRTCDLADTAAPASSHGRIDKKENKCQEQQDDRERQLVGIAGSALRLRYIFARNRLQDSGCAFEKAFI